MYNGMYIFFASIDFFLPQSKSHYVLTSGVSSPSIMCTHGVYKDYSHTMCGLTAVTRFMAYGLERRNLGITIYHIHIIVYYTTHTSMQSDFSSLLAPFSTLFSAEIRIHFYVKYKTLIHNYIIVKKIILHYFSFMLIFFRF